MSRIFNITHIRTERVLVALFLALVLTANSVVRAERVLCFGEDGHVVLEAALSGECADALPENACTDATPHFDAHPEDDCGPCEDIAVGADLAQHAAKRSVHASGLSAAVAVATLPSADVVHHAAPHTARGDMPFTVPSILIRSVALQC